MTSGSALPRGAWKTLTYTLEDGTATLYLDGVQVGENTDVTIEPGDIGGGRTTANYIGRSLLHRRQRTSRARCATSASTTARCPRDRGRRRSAPTHRASPAWSSPSLKVPAVIDAAARTVVLPVTPGTDLTALAPAFQPSSASTVSPERHGRGRPTEPEASRSRRQDGIEPEWTVQRRRDALPGAAGAVRRPEHRAVRRQLLHLRDDRRLRRLGRQGVLRLEVDEPRRLGALGRAVPDARRRERQRAVGDRQRLGADHHRARRQVLLLLLRPQPDVNRKTIGVAVADSPEGPFTAQPDRDDPQQRGGHVGPGDRPGRVPRPGDRASTTSSGATAGPRATPS